MNNIYLVTRKNDDADWDEYDSFVVIARDEDEARNTHPSGDNSDFNEPNRTWVDPSLVGVRYVGETDKDFEIILANFNAG